MNYGYALMYFAMYLSALTLYLAVSMLIQEFQNKHISTGKIIKATIVLALACGCWSLFYYYSH